MKITISTAQGTQTTYEYEQLAQMWKDGMLKVETLYWKEGMTDWKPLGELFAGLAPPPLPSGNPSPGRKISQMKRVNPQNGSTGIREKKFEKREGYSGKAFLSIISLILFYVGSNVFGNANSGFVLFATISLLLLAIILGHFARKDVKNKSLKGGWLALTTLILGYVSLLLVLK